MKFLLGWRHKAQLDRRRLAWPIVAVCVAGFAGWLSMQIPRGICDLFVYDTLLTLNPAKPGADVKVILITAGAKLTTEDFDKSLIPLFEHVLSQRPRAVLLASPFNASDIAAAATRVANSKAGPLPPILMAEDNRNPLGLPGSPYVTVAGHQQRFTDQDGSTRRIPLYAKADSGGVKQMEHVLSHFVRSAGELPLLPPANSTNSAGIAGTAGSFPYYPLSAANMIWLKSVRTSDIDSVAGLRGKLLVIGIDSSERRGRFISPDGARTIPEAQLLLHPLQALREGRWITFANPAWSAIAAMAAALSAAIALLWVRVRWVALTGISITLASSWFLFAILDIYVSPVGAAIAIGLLLTAALVQRQMAVRRHLRTQMLALKDTLDLPEPTRFEPDRKLDRARLIHAAILELRWQRAAFANALQILPVGVAVIDSRGNIVAANAALAKMSGKGQVHAGQSLAALMQCFEAMSSDFLSEVATTLQAVTQTRNLNGDLLWLSYLKVEGATAIDLSAIVTLHDLVQVKNAPCPRFDQLNALIHDLRTPVNAIMLSCQAGARHDTEETNTSATLDLIRQNIRRAGLMLDDLGNMLASGREYRISVSTVNVCGLLEDAVRTVGPRATKLGVALVPNLSAAAYVQSDAALLARIFTNLLENALTASPSGGQINVVLECDDTGFTIRIENAVIEKKESGATSFGIGIPFVKRSVERLGGTFSIKVEPTIARVSVTIPAGPVEPVALAAGAGDSIGQAVKQPQVNAMRTPPVTGASHQSWLRKLAWPCLLTAICVVASATAWTDLNNPLSVIAYDQFANSAPMSAPDDVVAVTLDPNRMSIRTQAELHTALTRLISMIQGDRPKAIWLANLPLAPHSAALDDLNALISRSAVFADYGMAPDSPLGYSVVQPDQSSQKVLRGFGHVYPVTLSLDSRLRATYGLVGGDSEVSPPTALKILESVNAQVQRQIPDEQQLELVRQRANLSAHTPIWLRPWAPGRAPKIISATDVLHDGNKMKSFGGKIVVISADFPMERYMDALSAKPLPRIAWFVAQLTAFGSGQWVIWESPGGVAAVTLLALLSLAFAFCLWGGPMLYIAAIGVVAAGWLTSGLVFQTLHSFATPVPLTMGVVFMCLALFLRHSCATSRTLRDQFAALKTELRFHWPDSIDMRTSLIETTTRTLDEERRFFSRVLQQLPVGIALLDRNHKIFAVNRALAKMLNKRASKLRGLCVQSLFARLTGTAVPPPLDLEAFRLRPQSIRTMDSVHVWVELKQLTSSANDRLSEMLVVVDARMAVQHTVPRSRAFNTMSRQLSRQLGQITERLSGCENSVSPSSDLPQALAQIHSTAHAIHDQLNDFLLLMRTEMQQDTTFEASELSTILDDVCDLAAIEAARRDVHLSRDIASGAVVRASWSLLSRAFEHVIDGAIRSAPAGTSARVELTSSDQYWTVAIRTMLNQDAKPGPAETDFTLWDPALLAAALRSTGGSVRMQRLAPFSQLVSIKIRREPAGGA